MGDLALAAGELRLWMSLLVCFSGQIGSGKSSVSAAVSETLGWPRAAFGDYLRVELERSGSNPATRQALQDLGQQRFDSDPSAFCNAVLTAAGFRPGDDFIVDGIRHAGAIQILGRLALPSQARLIHIITADSTRNDRIRTRPDRADLDRAVKHPVESNLRNVLPAYADLVISNDRSLIDTVSACVANIRRWQVIEPPRAEWDL